MKHTLICNEDEHFSLPTEMQIEVVVLAD
jgi:hypothetical protein